MLDRVLQALPAYLDREPGEMPGVSLSYAGTSGTATVASRRLTTRVTGGTGAALDLDLEALTLAGLATALNAEPGYAASLEADDGAVGAIALLEATDVDIVSTAKLRRHGTVLWALLSPAGWALEDAQDRIRAGLRQMSVRTADGPWVDLWGLDYYGGIRRALGEADRDYADRIIREALRRRLNGHAIELILREDIGLESLVSNLHERAWVISRTPFGRLAGRKYSRTTFEALVFGISAGVAAAVERNRAAGTVPYYAYREQLGAPGGHAEEAPTVVRSTPRVATDTVWTVGRDRLGLRLSIPHNVEIAESALIAVGDVVTGGSGASFVLGVSDLGGPDVLGDTGPPGAIALSDSPAWTGSGGFSGPGFGPGFDTGV